jgi:hypothetical protein
MVYRADRGYETNPLLSCLQLVLCYERQRWKKKILINEFLTMEMAPDSALFGGSLLFSSRPIRGTYCAGRVSAPNKICT